MRVRHAIGASRLVLSEALVESVVVADEQAYQESNGAWE